MAWNQPSSIRPKVNKRYNGSLFLPIVCSVVIAVVVCVSLFFINDKTLEDTIPTKTISRTQISEHQPSTNSIRTNITQPAKVAKKPKVKIPPKPSFMDEKPREEWDSREIALAYQWYAQDSGNRVEGVDMNSRVPPPVFSNLTQEAMAPYLELGADVIPIDRISDEEARIAIDTPIDFKYDDPDELLEKKQGVKEMLEELKQFMNDGGHAQEYFDRLASRQALELEAMDEVRNQVRKLEKEGDVEGAKEALEVYNKYLEGKGLPRIHMRIRNKQPQIEE